MGLVEVKHDFNSEEKSCSDIRRGSQAGVREVRLASREVRLASREVRLA